MQSIGRKVVENWKRTIEERAICIANYIIEHDATVRQTDKTFGASKSTVHIDTTERFRG